MVSAFGGIGLTLGIPTDNYSFSGAFRPLSKLIVCVIMLRGRHRGLPVAIDRASRYLCSTLRDMVLPPSLFVVLLPSELVPNKTTEAGATQTAAEHQNTEAGAVSGPTNQKVIPTPDAV